MTATKELAWDVVSRTSNTKDRLLMAAQIIAQPEQSVELASALKQDVDQTIKEIHKIYNAGQESLGAKDVAFILESIAHKLSKI